MTTFKRNNFNHLVNRYNGNKRHRQSKIDIATQMKVPQNQNRVYFALAKLIEIHPNYLCREVYTDNLTYKLYYVGGKRLFVTDSAEQLNLMVNKFRLKFPHVQIAVISQ